MLSEVCVFDVYQQVFAHARVVFGRGDREETRSLQANLDALVGRARIAAALAKCDAQAGREARPLSVICCAVCERPCELHPRFGAFFVQRK
jgi:hypothetical protein